MKSIMRRVVIATAAYVACVGCATPGAAQVDWRGAGGALLAGEEVADAAPSMEAAVDGESIEATTRVSPLRQPYAAEIQAAAERHGLDPKLLHALVLTESAYRPDVCSSAGACGLTQLMPGTARELGVVDRSDPVQNLFGGADYLTRQLRRFGDVRLALAAYNSGPGRVARLGRIPDIAETRAYVSSVVECYLALTAGRSVRSSRSCGPREAAP